jgi:phospholipid-binding lipoprotein MlaA
MRMLSAVLTIGSVLSGCAGREVIYHRLPSERPAANNAADIARAQGLEAAAAAAAKVTQQEAADADAKAQHAGAGQGGQPGEGANSGEEPIPLVRPSDAPSLKDYDPWAPLNRFTYRFNARFDEAVFLPTANTYRRVFPSFARSGIHNFFSNLSEIDSVINYTLQGRLGRGVRSLGRLVINSTLGIGGLFDPAGKEFHIDKAPTGFGTTLAKWGMHPGPYFVLPFLGPSTLREGIGYAADYGTLYVIDPAWVYRGDQSWAAGLLNAVDQRANVDFRYYSTGSPFEYETIRFLYVRKQLIEDAGLHRTKPVPKPDPNVPAGQ